MNSNDCSKDLMNLLDSPKCQHRSRFKFLVGCEAHTKDYFPKNIITSNHPTLFTSCYRYPSTMQSTPPASKKETNESTGPPAVNRPGLDGRAPPIDKNENDIGGSELVPPPRVHQVIIPDSEGVGDLAFLEQGITPKENVGTTESSDGVETLQVNEAVSQKEAGSKNWEDSFDEELQGLAIVEKEDLSISLDDLD